MQKKQYDPIPLENLPVLLANEALNFIGEPQVETRKDLLTSRNEFSEDVTPSRICYIPSTNRKRTIRNLYV